jgi:hypothetical protein
MARKKPRTGDERARTLRGLSHQVHRKRPLEDVLLEYIEDNLRQGGNREFRPAEEALRTEGPAAALKALDLIGDEASRIIGCVIAADDHRLLSAALDNLADFQDENGP